MATSEMKDPVSIGNVSSVERLLKGVVDAADIILNSRDLSAGFKGVLNTLCRAMDETRIILFRHCAKQNGGYIVDEALFPGCPTSYETYKGLLLDKDFPEVMEPLKHGDIYTSATSDKTGANKVVNTKSGTKIDLMVPIFVAETFWGFICFDRLLSETPFTNSEIDALRGAAAVLASAIMRDALVQERLDLERLRADENERHVQLLQDILVASRELLEGENFEAQLENWLERLGKSCGAHHSGYGVTELNSKDGTFNKIYALVTWIDPAYAGVMSSGGEIPPTEDFDKWAHSLSKKQYVWANYSELVDPDSRLYWDSIGCKANVVVPVDIGDSEIGWLYFDFAEERQENAVQLSAIQTAAESLGAAIRQNTTQKSLLEAKRLRLEELGRTNLALAKSMKTLNENATPKGVVDGISAIMADTLGGEIGTVFLVNKEAKTLEWFSHSSPASAMLLEDLHGFSTPLSEIPAWSRILKNAEPTVMFPSAPNHDGIHPQTVAYMNEHDLCWLVNFPLLVGDEPQWLLAVVGRDDARLTDSNLTLFKTLSHQLRLALELKRLGDDSSQAIVKEATANAEKKLLEERSRLAGQIHDTLAQGFTGTMLHLEALAVRLERGEAVKPEELQKVRDIAAFGLSEARRTAITMRPLKLDGRSFLTALHQLVERSCIPDLLTCRIDIIGSPKKLPYAIEEMMLCIAHEAVNNAIRHADASSVEIALSYAKGSASLKVKDNGKGFKTSLMETASGRSFGLVAMYERARQNHSTLTVNSAKDKGTQVTVEWKGETA